MAISEDHDYALNPEWIYPVSDGVMHSISHDSGGSSINRHDTCQNAPKRLIRDLFDPDGYEFPANLDIAERAMITAQWWIDGYIDRAMREFKRLMRNYFKRDATAAECAHLINRVFDCRKVGSLPYDLNLAMQVFVKLKGEKHG